MNVSAEGGRRGGMANTLRFRIDGEGGGGGGGAAGLV